MIIDWTQNFKRYKGLWLALKDDEKTVIASAATAKGAWLKAEKKGYQNPILAKMPSRLINYVGSGI